MEKEKKRKIIINYIRSHSYCTKEKVIEGVSSEISRVPAYSILGELIEDKTVIDDKKNRRNHRLYVNESNLLTIIPDLLDELEYNLTKFLNDVALIFRKKWLASGFIRPARVTITAKGHTRRSPAAQLLYFFFLIYKHAIEMIFMSSISIWPTRIEDPKSLETLYEIVFNRLAKIQVKVSRIMSTEPTLRLLMSRGNKKRMQSMSILLEMIEKSYGLRAGVMVNFIQLSKQFGVLDKAEKLLDVSWETGSQLITSDPNISRRLTGIIAENSEEVVKDWRHYLQAILPEEWEYCQRNVFPSNIP